MTVYHGLLQRRLELYLGGVWVDFSARLLTQTLSPNPGRTSGGNRVSPSTLNFNLDNPLGDLTPYNAASAYYPHVDVGMLVRWSVYWDGNWYVRGVFEATEVQPHWPYGDLSDGTTTGRPGESYVTIAAADILQRLSDDQRPLQSALFRSMVGVAEGDYVPHAYWSMEDGENATQFASALPDGPAMTFTGDVSLASESDLAGSEPLATFGDGAFARFSVPTYIDTEKWAIQTMVKLTASRTIYDLTTAGSARRIVVAYNSATATYDVDMYDAAGASVYGGDMPATADTLNTWVSITFSLNATTATDFYNFTVTPIGTEVSYGLGDLVSGRYGRLVGGTLMYGATGAAGVGHHAVFTDPNFNHGIDDIYHARAGTGWTGETAGRRLERLCREEGIAFTSAGDLDETSPMGPQATSTLYEAFSQCEATDLGIFHAQRDANGVHYRTRGNLYSQAAALVLDAANSEVANPFRPAATAKHIVNDVTVNRPDGSSGRAIDQDSIDKVGFRPRDYDANTETDTQLTDIAGWLLNLGTPDGMHYPSLSTELTIATQLIPDWLALALGDRLQVVNLPPQHPADTVDLLVDGYTEPHSPSRWTPQINCSPAAPWDVAELDDDDNAKLDTDGSDLNTSATPTGTTLQVATQAGTSPLWTTDAGEMPIPLIVGGEVMSATAVAAPTTITYGAVGTATHASNASVTPGIPASVAAGNLLVVLAAIRNSGTGVPDTPSGYTRLPVFGVADNVQLFAKVAVGGDSAPAITFTGGVANATTSAQMIRIAGAFSTPAECFVSGQALLNSSAQDIAYPGLPLEEPVMATAIHNAIVIYVGWKQDDWTSVATISGATEIAEASSTTGDDQALVWDYVIQTTATDIREGSFTVTGGASAISRGAVFAIRSNVQAFTVTRSVNGVVKSQSAGTAVNVYKPWRFAL